MSTTIPVSTPTASRAASHPARDHCLAPTRTVDTPLGAGRYGRLFPELEPLVADESLIQVLGRAGGPCDGTQRSAGDDDAATAAGWPFFGQFVAHDITADRSALTHHADAASLRNARRLQLDLECLYGGGPAGSPYLYDRSDGARLLLVRNDAGGADDVMRNAQGTAIIGDPRNDVHLVMSQLHVAMIKTHNRLVDRFRADGVPDGDLFAEAERAMRWHYHWIVLHDFLPRLIGESLTTALRRDGPQYFRPAPGESFIPLEFADAAYRYGHSQIRHAYRLNGQTDPVPLFPDLLGFRPVAAKHAIDWTLFFDARGERSAQRAKRIDGRLPASLMRLPQAITGDVEMEAHHSLAVRDLQRGIAVGLPSGEAVARHLGIAPLSADEIGLAAVGWRSETPLWYYVLKEAEVRGNGDSLGPVGGRIVGEVIVGLLTRDSGSFLTVDPSWRPTLPAADIGQFTLADLLTFAHEAGGVDGSGERG